MAELLLWNLCLFLFENLHSALLCKESYRRKEIKGAAFMLWQALSRLVSTLSRALMVSFFWGAKEQTQ